MVKTGIEKYTEHKNSNNNTFSREREREREDIQ